MGYLGEPSQVAAGGRPLAVAADDDADGAESMAASPCRDPRTRSRCGDKLRLRKAILTALPYASAVGAALRRSQLVEDEVLVEDLQSLGGLGGS